MVAEVFRPSPPRPEALSVTRSSRRVGLGGRRGSARTPARGRHVHSPSLPRITRPAAATRTQSQEGTRQILNYVKKGQIKISKQKFSVVWDTFYHMAEMSNIVPLVKGFDNVYKNL